MGSVECRRKTRKRKRRRLFGSLHKPKSDHLLHASFEREASRLQSRNRASRRDRVVHGVLS